MIRVDRDRPIHIVLRYADNFAGTADTIKSHNEIARKSGYVWLGKLGYKTLSHPLIEDLNRRSKSRSAPLLYMVKCSRGRFTTHYAKIVETRRTKPRDAAHIPGYYPKDRPFSLWFKIRPFRPAQNYVLFSLIVISSRNPVSNSLASSMAPYFIVSEDEDRLAEILTHKARFGTFPEMKSSKKGKPRGTRIKSEEELLREDLGIAEDDFELINSFNNQ